LDVLGANGSTAANKVDRRSRPAAAQGRVPARARRPVPRKRLASTGRDDSRRCPRRHQVGCRRRRCGEPMVDGTAFAVIAALCCRRRSLRCRRPGSVQRKEQHLDGNRARRRRLLAVADRGVRRTTEARVTGAKVGWRSLGSSADVSVVALTSAGATVGASGVRVGAGQARSCAFLDQEARA
jgi:hypothetical protein